MICLSVPELQRNLKCTQSTTRTRTRKSKTPGSNKGVTNGSTTILAPSEPWSKRQVKSNKAEWDTDKHSQTSLSLKMTEIKDGDQRQG